MAARHYTADEPGSTCARNLVRQGLAHTWRCGLDPHGSPRMHSSSANWRRLRRLDEAGSLKRGTPRPEMAHSNEPALRPLGEGGEAQVEFVVCRRPNAEAG